MEDKTKLLIAVGAALAVNCQPCLKTLIKKSREAGVQDKEILEAIGVARLVRKNSMTQIDKFAQGVAGIAEGTDEDTATGCGCK
jgi:AhpD family alkylhydroperoxidase